MKARLTIFGLTAALAALTQLIRQFPRNNRPAAPCGHRRELHPRRERPLLRAAALKEGGFGKFEHEREVAPIDNQTVIRMNRDTLYSSARVRPRRRPVTITLPDAGKRFMSMQVID